jgi:hypothetical protein
MKKYYHREHREHRETTFEHRSLWLPFIELPEAIPTGLPLECLDKQRLGASPRILSIEAPEEEADHEPVIVCRQCRNHITDESHRLSVEGANRHTFANPHGFVYEIDCFGSAVGCYRTGPLSDEFTWFKGYSWQAVICADCMTHLGWLFVSSGPHHFFGLIVDRLASSL